MLPIDARHYARDNAGLTFSTANPLNTSGTTNSLSDVRIYSSSLDNSEDRDSYKSEYSLFHLGQIWRNLYSYRNIEDYFKWIISTLTINILCFLINLWQIYYISPNGGRWSSDNTLGVVSLFSAICGAVVVVVLVRSLFRPKPFLAGFAWGLIIAQLVLYICQIIIYYQPDPYYMSSSAEDANAEMLVSSVICSVVLFLFQSLTALVVYRYWEFLYFNYDHQSHSVFSLSDSLLDRGGSEEAGSLGDLYRNSGPGSGKGWGSEGHQGRGSLNQEPAEAGLVA